MSKMPEKAECGSVYLAAGTDYQASRAVIFGVPMDYTASHRPGSRSGPQAIRVASLGLEEYSIYSGKDLRDACFYDAGDLALPMGNTARSLAVIEDATEIIFAAKKFPILLGGEHLVSLGALRAAVKHYPKLAVLHFDAHADLRTDYLGEPYSHASVMYHVYTELGAELFQFGIRSATREEETFAKEHTHYYPFHVFAPLKEAMPLLVNRPVYLSLDIDVVDPAFAPGTGTPEPGGISSVELLEALALLRHLPVVGMDLVEVTPVYDSAGITAMLAAKVIREIILAFA
ncbi:MAG: agmatinase [Dethiobacter sp.]